jgi:hypothetical protein
MASLSVRVPAYVTPTLLFYHPLDIFQQALRVQHQGPDQLPNLRLDVFRSKASRLRASAVTLVRACRAEIVVIEALVPASLAAPDLRHPAPAGAADEHAGELPIPVLGGGFATDVVLDGFSGGVYVLAGDA